MAGHIEGPCTICGAALHTAAAHHAARVMSGEGLSPMPARDRAWVVALRKALADCERIDGQAAREEHARSTSGDRAADLNRLRHQLADAKGGLRAALEELAR